ncbi:hypothetical protein LUZ63_008141 [Rhynchospora breviuscula]|uniref:SHSP domain-containing protein n=1 Tax=Rhynchospora breviuscula TaxID=2022672 RepID=A0A9Q0HV40_9POAL|nr:hypothetical protein LUZ63_008141 [Rhynchospora breviuscula]
MSITRRRRSNTFDAFPFPFNFNHSLFSFPPCPSSSLSFPSDTSSARVDWRENSRSEAHVFKANLPGMRKEEVLSRLPDNAKMDQVKAAMENGVLTVTVPKEEVKKP